jgi:hypothetical protein
MSDVVTGLGITIFGDGYTGGTAQTALVASVINNALKVDNSGITQPITGTITSVPSGTQTVSVDGTVAVTGTVYSSNITTDATKVVSQYGEVNSVASLSSGDIYYTLAPSSTLYLKGIMASSSGGPCKVIIDHGVLSGGTITTGTTIATGFYSSAVPYLMMEFVQAEIITSGLSSHGIRVRIINNNVNAQNVYAKIMGQKS